MTKTGLWVLLLGALCVAWPVSRVVRQQARMAQPCHPWQQHDAQGYCRMPADVAAYWDNFCRPIGGPFNEDVRRCEVVIDGRAWYTLMAQAVDSQGGACPVGYSAGKYPETCLSNQLLARFRAQEAAEAATQESAAQFNAEQQAKRELQQSIQEAVRAENRREALIRGDRF